MKKSHPAFAGIHLYSPAKNTFEQTWKPDDIEKVEEGR